MSKPVNPFTIGAFLVGAITLLITGLLVFGGGQFFKKKIEYVIFFDSALNGLNVGAPVKLQGVQIGTVKEIALEIDTATVQILKPVVIEFDPELMRDSSGQPLKVAMTLKQRRKNAERLIAAGLKARLETQSLLTGLLYVEFNFYPDEPVNLTGQNYKDLPELPSIPTTADEIKNAADEIMDKIRKLPLEEMVKDLAETLHEARDLMKSEDLKKSLASLAKTLEATERLTATLNNKANPLLTDADAALTETRVTVQEFRKEMLPVLTAAEQSLTTATKVLQESQHTVNAVEMLTAPDSVLGQALIEMRDASRSIKDLSDTLERQPDSLIYGK